ncbi:MAG: hypothetical protein JWP98_1664 [Edaphobacter sp.]|nr:hypothetical protein [Edaphobacter sp.]
MQRRACLYFTEQVDPASGQVLDRALNKVTVGTRDNRFVSSIAATGFGLAALCIAERRRFISMAQARKQVQATLRFHLQNMPHQNGFFYHFNDVETGQPLVNSEVSPVDTSILLCGVLTCRAYFSDPEITKLATALYERVEWPWMLNTGRTFSKAWKPDIGFLYSRWEHYSEAMMLYLLAIGSPTNPVAPGHWNSFTRPRMEFGPYTYISGPDPLFVHQYSHAFFDFAHKRDVYADYFTNSITATRAHKAFCLSLNRGYTEDYWGVSASDWQHGYTAWGGPPLQGPVDGSVVPSAVAGSLPFLPAECLRVLRSLKNTYSEDAEGRYGFCDSFHPQLDWYDPDVLGIDLGIGVLMAENLRSGLIWNTFMKNPEAVTAMKLCGFRNI